MLLRPSVIERFVLSVEATVSGPTRRTLRTNLRYVAARLRSTWLAAVAEGIGLRAFMDAAGICCSQRLGEVVGAQPSRPDPQLRASPPKQRRHTPGNTDESHTQM